MKRRIKLSRHETNKIKERYKSRFQTWGHDEQSVGWGKKGRQRERFKFLLGPWQVEDKKILDIGAGFGDLYSECRNCQEYLGIDVVPELVSEGMKAYGNNVNFKLMLGDFLDPKFKFECDLVFISGTFNFKIEDWDNYEFIAQTLTKGFSLAAEGLSFNFIRDETSYKEDLIFYSNISKLIQIVTSLTPRYALHLDYMPFEGTIHLFKSTDLDEQERFYKRNEHFSKSIDF